jgi:hypothetical protein
LNIARPAAVTTATAAGAITAMISRPSICGDGWIALGGD